ncbi:MAG: helix-turn-helix transcriptional regulator [Sphingobium sp.]
MAATISDQLDMLLPLVESLSETPPWVQFMTALVARTQAQRGILFISLANAPADQEPTAIQISARSAAQQPAIDISQLMNLGLHPYGMLRPGRVYSVDEMLNYDDRNSLADQRGTLDSLGIRYGRWLRVTADGVADAWILLTREREDFTSGAVATLAAIAPYLRAALRAFATLSEQRLLRIMAHTTLGRLGVGQVALDETGRVIAADDLANNYLAFVETPDDRPGRRLQLPPASAEKLKNACAEFALASADAAAPVMIEAGDETVLMVQPAPFSVAPGLVQPAAVATFRLDIREDERRGGSVLRNLFSLSDREAMLAEKLSRGTMIVDAGRQLRLTPETARNYSKRIYARTGASGQADLVRMILCGLAPLA